MSETITKSTPYRKKVSFTRQTVLKNGSYSQNVTSSSSLSGTDSFVGVKNPRWKQQVKSGVQAGTPMTGVRYRSLTRPCYISQEMFNKNGSPLSPTSPQFYIQSGSLSPPWPSSPVGLSEALADNLAKKYISRKIRGAQTSFQGLVFSGEFRETVGLITHSALKLKRGVFDYGRKLLTGRKKILRRAGNRIKNLTPKQRTKLLLENASNEWLEFQLGWAPLLSDIDSAAETLANYYAGDVSDRWKPVRAVGIDKQVISDQPAPYPTAVYPCYFATRLRTSTTVSVRYIACVDHGLVSQLNNQRVGFAPTNWLPAIWELIPYSFVIDYFTNVGSIIDAACLQTSSVRWVIRTVRRESKREFYNWTPRYGDLGAQGHYPLGNIPGKSVQTVTSVERAPYEGSLVPNLDIHLPNNAKQVANIFGLLVMRNKLKNYFR